MTDISEKDVWAGQAAYTPFTLSVYNFFVLGFSNAYVWRCPTRFIQDAYQENITENHLDVGVGTGYFLEMCHWPAGARVSLMDMNENCLSAAARAISRHGPTLYQRDIYQVQDDLKGRFRSISANFLFHCLPGDMGDKSRVFGNIADMLRPGGVVFGATIISDRNCHSFLSRQFIKTYNRMGIFHNLNDTRGGLIEALEDHFDSVEVDVQGCVALFRGVKR